MEIHGWRWLVACAAAALAAADLQLRPAGWLDRVVAFYKNTFLHEIQQLAPIEIQASIEKAPAGYVDSSAWDLDSVSRLLGLLSASASARPVRRALRRALAPARRFMSRQKSYKYFPSLSQMHASNMYYDVDTDEDYASEELPLHGVPPDDAVVQVRNPVEARLPSARISVHLLREILEARAIAARKMPPTRKTTSGIVWPSSSAQSTSEMPAVKADNATDTNATDSASGAEDGGGGAGGGDGKADGAGEEGKLPEGSAFNETKAENETVT